MDAPEYAQRAPVIEDLALLQIAFPNAYAAIHMGWGEGVGGVDVSGSEGQIRMRYNQYQSGGFNQAVELYSIDSDWQRTDHAIANLEEHMGNIARSFTELWQDFQAAIRDDREPIAPAGRRRSGSWKLFSALTSQRSPGKSSACRSIGQARSTLKASTA